jgi:hypothetical protein
MMIIWWDMMKQWDNCIMGLKDLTVDLHCSGLESMGMGRSFQAPLIEHSEDSSGEGRILFLSICYYSLKLQ